MFVSRSRVTVAVGAVLLWAGTPVLACLLPCLATPPAQQECYRHVAMHCGRTMISAAPRCCQVSSHRAIATVETQVSQWQKRALVVVAVINHVYPSVVTSQLATLVFSESPPDQASPPSSSVLRI
jgi:hypothetical protein